MIVYQIERNLQTPEFRDILITSGLGARRPVDDLERIAKMLNNSNLIFTARDGALLVGVARCVTDFVYCTYLSDLAVDQAYQGKGIGTELIRRTKLETPRAKLILISAPAAVQYYLKIGMDRHENCYVLDDVNLLK